ALTIAGSDSGGGAGIQADLKTFAALGVHGVSVITSLTAQNTRAVRGIFEVPPEFIAAQFRAVHEDFKIRAAKTGMLSSKEIIKMVAREVGSYLLVVDPVMVAASGGRLLREDAVEALAEKLFPKAALVTPNLFEAQVLSGLRIRSTEDMKKAGKKISKCGCSVLVKGGHLNAADVLYFNKKFYEFRSKKFSYSAHGSGCVFASAVAAELAKGKNLLEAVGSAKLFITDAIKGAYAPGKGARVTNPIGEVLRDSEKFRIISELKEAVNEIKKVDEFYKLVPQVGTNIAYALPDAGDLNEVAGISGRIIRIKEQVKAIGEVEFGASKHVASIVLAAMKFDPAIRAAMNIRYSSEALAACRKLRFMISSFSRKEEPRGVSTMEWGTVMAIKKLGSVPDIIYDLGSIRKEPMIRILGKSPAEVLGKVRLICAKQRLLSH
ncbi:MAG: bifunctional hydroxymethylpyrimidine kinase/phosphomethylpyrimidine kinase, partial [Euryarchaeota archaeon]|nr:bifunctional hydroxymethylpyrimidine kinase/phosphomethylpyrimidine kinase [Euryarchaeota archaeon]